MQTLLVCWLTLWMTFSDASWCPLWFRVSLLADVSAETWLSRDVSHFKMLAIVRSRVTGEFCGGADGHGHEGNNKARKGGRGQASPVAMTSPVEEGRSPVWPPLKKGHLAAGFFLHHSFETYRCGLPVA